MTDEQINIAVAESSGWYPHPDNDKREQKFWTYGGGGYGLPNGCDRRAAADPPIHYGQWEDVPRLPDYCNDLNVMHEALQTLISTEQQNQYINNIAEVCWADVSRGNNQVVFNQLTSTARQQAEAFLKVIGKWEE